MKRRKNEQGSMICIRPEGTYNVCAFTEDFLTQAYKLQNDLFEAVRVQRSAGALARALPDTWEQVILLVPESGMINNLPFNLYASWLLGYQQPFAGNAIVVTESCCEDGKRAIAPLRAFQQRAIRSILQSVGCRWVPLEEEKEYE